MGKRNVIKHQSINIIIAIREERNINRVKHNVLVNPTIAHEGIEILQKECNVYTLSGSDENSIIECINKYNANAIFVRVELITREVIKNCNSLKIIQEHGIGCDNIDIEAATEHGVMVLNIPGGSAVAVSEHAIMMILALTNNLLVHDRYIKDCIRTGTINYSNQFNQIRLEGKNLFIMGMGNIGCKVSKKMFDLGMNICAFDKYVPEEKMKKFGAEKVDRIEYGLEWADIVSIHLPLVAETKNMISTRELSLMKPTAFLINVSRGGLVDEDALYYALKEKMIAGAGIDVFLKEPISRDKNRLIKLRNVIVSPHCAGASLEGKTRPSVLGAKIILSALRGEPISKNLVNRTLKKLRS